MEQQLQFDAPSKEDIVIQPEIQKTKKVDVSQYDNLPLNQRRLKILYAIKNNELDSSNFPPIFKKMAELIKANEDGKLSIVNTNPIDSELGRLYPKVTKFILTGILGDLADAKNNHMLTKIANKIIKELEKHLHDDHPTRRLEALDKSGKLDDIIKYNMKQFNYDLFTIPWFKDVIKLIAVQDRKVQQNESYIFYKEQLKFELNNI